MAENGSFEAKDLVKDLAQTCIGFHFSNEKAFGKTTHAYLLKSSKPGGQLQAVIDGGPAKGIYNISAKGESLTAELQLIRMLFDFYQAKQNSLSIQTSAVLAPIQPLTVLVQGSMVNSIATPCMVKGVVQKTGAFASIESDIIGFIIAASMRVGYNPSPGSAAHAIKHLGVYQRLTRSATLTAFFNTTGFRHSMAMATALFNVWTAHINLKEGYSDAGARFRDSTSRKLAQAAFDDALHTALYTIHR